MDRKEIISHRYALLADTLVTNLNNRGFNAVYVPSKEEALKTALSYLPQGCSVGMGGTLTAEEIGLTPYLKNSKDYRFIDRESAKDHEEKEKLAHEALNADYFIASANAVSLDGTLFEIDGRSNRIGALVYGASHVIFIIGMNKVCLNEEEALSRAKNVAAPLNALRLNCKTPCALKGYCLNCTGPSSICSNILQIRKPNVPQRFQIILVGEDLGL